MFWIEIRRLDQVWRSTVNRKNKLTIMNIGCGSKVKTRIPLFDLPETQGGQDTWWTRTPGLDPSPFVYCQLSLFDGLGL